MTYSSPENVEFAAAIFAFAVIPGFREIRSPGYDMYNLSFGVAPNEQQLCSTISSCTTFENSSEASLSQQQYECYSDFDARRRNLFRNECLEEQKRLVNSLLPWSPCHSVSIYALHPLSPSRYNKSDLIVQLDHLYANCYRNYLLKTYLDDVQNVLDEARRAFIPSVKQTYQFIPSNLSVVSVTTVVLTEDFLRKPPPVIALLSDPLEQSHESDMFPRGRVDPTPLGHVISTFLQSRSRSDQFGRQYAEHLEESRRHLERGQSLTPPRSTRCTDVLQHYHTWCSKLYSSAFLSWKIISLPLV